LLRVEGKFDARRTVWHAPEKFIERFGLDDRSGNNRGHDLKGFRSLMPSHHLDKTGTAPCG
jgi:hypothetical protein